MSDILTVGATGVRAYQTALTTVSENIANASTAGYSRRATDLKEVSAPGRINTAGTAANGMGVIANGVSRSADAFRVADVRSTGADLASSQTSVQWLDRIQSALTGNQLGGRLTSFFASTSALAADPTTSAPRSTMLEAGTSVANAFTGTGAALDQVGVDLDGTAENAVTTLNGLGSTLGRINDAIGRASAGSSSAANLADQRDQLLEQMSAITDTSVSMDASGRATVKLGGAGGPVFVSGNVSGQVTYVRSGGVVSYSVHRDAVASVFGAIGGALAGIADGAQKLTDARTRLDTLAGGFVTDINAAQALGRDLDGNPGATMFAAGAKPTDIALTLTDLRGIAAAAPGGGSRDNSNLANFAAARTSGGSEAGVTDLVSTNAAALGGRQQVADAQTSIHDGAVAARDSVSGVNLDDEAVDLLRFQQGYQASSRVIQVARETFQSILDIR